MPIGALVCFVIAASGAACGSQGADSLDQGAGPSGSSGSGGGQGSGASGGDADGGTSLGAPHGPDAGGSRDSGSKPTPPGDPVDASVPSDASTGGQGGKDAGGKGGGPKDSGSPPVDSGSSASTDAGDAITAARVLCVQIINQDRATLTPPSPALVEATAEESCVDQQAQADYEANTAHSAFGKCKEFAQDECPGWAGPPSSLMTGCLKAMWAEGPPAAGQDNHWLNMSNAKYTKVACGFYQTPSGDWWATQDFW
jgi:hypothetical protein